jgi:tetratricopeptide (TPR) repeat protein
MGYAKITREKLVIPTYQLGEPEKAPLFFELRNHQGTRGGVYPIPMIDKLQNRKADRIYDAIRLENEFLRVTLLPELGGRVYEGYDKKADYHFVYKNNVIKPAMIGLAGAWISGGIEFNWPQHHRPTTFMPVDAVIEGSEDGEQTAWMGEIEPLFGTKGMIGVSIHPDRSYIKLKARLYNPTDRVQTFHWWANLAVHTGDSYQLQFPPDIDYITYHYKDAVAPFPVVRGEFARVDFGDEGEDITWYKNIHGPASFFIFNSRYNFMGGYDHARQRGTVHVADRHISPGKKFFTWGNGDFGDAWQRNLTDSDGPYIEIMTGCFTDNQPDFSFLAPYETKEFEQIWFATQQLPHLKNASAEGAVSLTLEDGRIHLGALTTAMHPRAKVVLTCDGRALMEEVTAIGPGQPFVRETEAPGGCRMTQLELTVVDEAGQALIGYREGLKYFDDKPAPRPHMPSKAPNDIGTVEELYLEGLQIEQYRHPMIDPSIYYLEGLRRDPMNARLNCAMGQILMKQARFQEAEACFRSAVARLNTRNYNPRDCEALYHLGVALRRLSRPSEALDWFFKAAWDARWRAAALQQSAEILLALGEAQKALDCARSALKVNQDGLGLRMLISAALRRLGRFEEAADVARETIALDRLDYAARNELALSLRALGREEEAEAALNALRGIVGGRAAPWLHLSGQYLDAGLWDDALTALESCPATPLSEYYAAFAEDQLGREAAAEVRFNRADAASPDYCFPWMDRELSILSHAVERRPLSGRAPYLLGLMYYGRGDRERAIRLFEDAVRRGPDLAEAHRCLAIGWHDVLGLKSDALRAMRRAFELNRNARYLLELSQAMKAAGVPAAQRLEALERNLDLAASRDDLYTEYVALLNLAGAHEAAAEALKGHMFHPYEGGEGLLVRQHILTYLMLGRAALARGSAESALAHFETALSYPANYNEGRKYRAREAHVQYHIALAAQRLGDIPLRDRMLEACAAMGDAPDEAQGYKALALKALGRASEAATALRRMIDAAEEMIEGRRDTYFGGFATGLPFEQNPERLDAEKGHMAKTLALLALGEQDKALDERRRWAGYTDQLTWFELFQRDANAIGEWRA